MIHIEVLGPVFLRSQAGCLSPRGLRGILLIALLAARGHPVSHERLSTELWGLEKAPRSGNGLHTNISKLRYEIHRLEPGRTVPRLRRLQYGGYALEREGIVTDADEFTTGVARLEEQAPGEVTGEAAGFARRLMALWRGPVFGGLVGGPICQAAADSLEQTRLRTLEILYDVELENGRHSAIVADLSELALTRTSRQESFCEQAMIALYRCGRQADAVDLYHRVREEMARANEVVTQKLRQCNRAVQAHAALLNQPRPRVALAGLC